MDAQRVHFQEFRQCACRRGRSRVTWRFHCARQPVGQAFELPGEMRGRGQPAANLWRWLRKRESRNEYRQNHRSEDAGQHARSHGLSGTVTAAELLSALESIVATVASAVLTRLIVSLTAADQKVTVQK